MTSETIKVKVLESRQVADDLYVVGEVVEMAPERHCATRVISSH